MEYIFSLAGKQYLLIIDKAIEIIDRHKPFIRLNDHSRTSGLVRIRYAEELPEMPADVILEQGRYYSPSEEEKTWFMNYTDYSVFAYSDRTKAPDSIEISYNRQGNIQLFESNVLTLLLETETMLCYNKGVMMHGCTVETDRGGLIFTGPSGIGKSTQGNLWTRYTGARVLNGDRAGMIFQDGRWYSYGLPFAGSSAIYINSGTPVKAIILLEQGQENRIERIPFSRAFSLLYPQAHLHKWSRKLMDLGTEHLIAIISSVPVYKLTCRPDEDAVRLVEKTVFGG